MTQDALSIATGWNRGYLSSIMTGERRYNADHLNSIAKALGITPAEVLSINPLSPKSIKQQVIENVDRLNEEQLETVMGLIETLAKQNRAPKP